LWYTNGGGAALYLDTSANLHLPVDDAKIFFGAGDDAYIKHNGSNLFINNDTGSININVGGANVIQVSTGSISLNKATRLDDNDMRFQEKAKTSTPASGFAQLFLDSDTGNLSALKDTGDVVDLETPGEGGGGEGGNDLAPTAVKTGTYVPAAWDAVLCDTSGGSFTLNLAASSAGDQILIKMVGTGTNILTINASGAETIDGELTKTLLAQYESMWLLADGSNWHIIG
jgi:hypothetical protein